MSKKQPLTLEQIDAESDFPPRSPEFGKECAEFAQSYGDRYKALRESLMKGEKPRTAEDAGTLVAIRAASVGAYRTAAYDGVDHFVVPLVALTEGVIHAVNAPNPELVLAEEFTSGYLGWNGRPLMADHPTRNGQQVSANDPEILEQECVGQVFNVRVNGKRLEMEAWINPEKAQRTEKGRALLERVAAKKPIEVSVGVHVLAEPRAGSHGGRAYTSVWRKIIPDHLAMLPEGHTGACSIEMGCGAFRPASAGGREDRFRALLAQVDWRALKGEPTGADKDAHPFTYCMENVVPAIESKQGKMDDPKAFCGWWKAERAAEAVSRASVLAEEAHVALREGRPEADALVTDAVRAAEAAAAALTPEPEEE